MAPSRQVPFALDGVVSDEKLLDLLAYQTEYAELDFKSTIDPSSTEGLIELAVDVGAMQVRAGYIVGGVDNQGVPTGGMDPVDLRAFDEARLRSKLLRYLPDPLTLHLGVHKIDGHPVVLIFVGRHPSGCAIFRADGQYPKGGETVVRFRRGEVFWRNGTSSERIDQAGLEEIFRGRLADAKADWLDEHQEMRRREREVTERAVGAARAARGALGSVSLDLPTPELVAAALELIRDDDRIALIHLFRGTGERARQAIEKGEVDTEFGGLLDKISCLAATFLVYEQDEWFGRTIAALGEIYSLAVPDESAALSFGYRTHISSDEIAPRIWLETIERVFAIGALAVRLKNWRAIRTLTLQLPERIDYGYEVNWLRHALTMASRAQHLDHLEDGRQVSVSLLALAREHIERLQCLRPDGIPGDADELFTALAQFDVLSNLTAVADAGSADSKVFFPNFARFRQSRVDPVARRLLTDAEMRRWLFPHSDKELAQALLAIGQVAAREGVRYDGFMGWEMDRGIEAFLKEHAPAL